MSENRTGKYVPPHLRNYPVIPKREVTAVTNQHKQPDWKGKTVDRMKVDWRNYENRLGKVTNHQVISEYSVTVDREVLNDRSNARYLIEENIRDGVHFDLVEGLDSFINREKVPKEPCLHPLCKWAIAQPGATIKEVFHGADFACDKGTLKKIAMTLMHTKDEWTMVAQNFGGVILISEQSKRYFGGRFDLAPYGYFKFKQYMTTDTPNGRPDTNSPVDNRATFEIMARTDLMDGENVIKLCCGTEIAALRGGTEGFEPIEFKTVMDGRTKVNRNIVTVIQSELMGVNSIVTGIKTGDFQKMESVVHKVVDNKLSDIKLESNNTKDVGKVYSFLFDVLSNLKKFIGGHEACQVSFDPFSREVAFKIISRKKANGNGHGVTQDFLDRFNISQREVPANEVPDAEEVVESMKVDNQACEGRSCKAVNHQVISQYSVCRAHFRLCR